MLTTLRRIVLQFSQNTDLDSALLRLVVQVKKAIKTDCCSVYLADYQKQHFLLMASDGLAKQSHGQTSIGFSEGLIGLVGQREEPINIADAKNHPHFVHAPEVEEENLCAFLGTPIIHQRKVIGILTIQQKQARHFTENEEAFLVTLSAQLAFGLANAEARSAVEQIQGVWQKQLQGVPGAPGVALGQIAVIQPKANLNDISLQKTSDITHQQALFSQAVEKARFDFSQLRAKLSNIIQDNSLDIFEFYQQLLEHGNLGKEVEEKLQQGWQVQSALKLVVDHYIMQFETLDDPYLRERASDIRDLGNRLLFNLQQQVLVNNVLPNEFILVAQDVTATMLAEYQHKGLKGVI